MTCAALQGETTGKLCPDVSKGENNAVQAKANQSCSAMIYLLALTRVALFDGHTA